MKCLVTNQAGIIFSEVMYRYQERNLKKVFQKLVAPVSSFNCNFGNDFNANEIPCRALALSRPNEFQFKFKLKRSRSLLTSRLYCSGNYHKKCIVHSVVYTNRCSRGRAVGSFSLEERAPLEGGGVRTASQTVSYLFTFNRLVSAVLNSLLFCSTEVTILHAFGVVFESRKAASTELSQ